MSVPVDTDQRGVLLFTQREYAENFEHNHHDMPSGAVIAPVEVPSLSKVLNEQQQLGRTHVVTDPVPDSLSYSEQRTLTISEYLNELGQLKRELEDDKNIESGAGDARDSRREGKWHTAPVFQVSSRSVSHSAAALSCGVRQ
jgi:hypothetical protein